MTLYLIYTPCHVDLYISDYISRPYIVGVVVVAVVAPSIVADAVADASDGSLACSIL